jgi:phytoene dehydrogenase-like protein
MRRLILIVALAAFWAPTADAGPIERACRTSGRPQATLALCACIQQAANGTLSRADQRRAVRFFRDPHKAQETRQSSRRADAAFWERYRSFGETAELRCGVAG